MNKKPMNNSVPHYDKRINDEKNAKEISANQGSPLLETQNSALKKILDNLFPEKKQG